MSQHQDFCKKLGKLMGISHHDAFHAYDQWKRDGLIELILKRDTKAISKAVSKYTWFGKTQKEVVKPRHTMNAFERCMDNVNIMSFAVRKIGSLEDAQEALDQLK